MNWLIGHLVGDYLVQNDWMANNKKARWWPAIVHCAVYAAVMELFTWWPLWTVPAVFLSHLALDKTMFVKHYCKWTRRDNFIDPKGIMFPWSWVSIDNTFHLLSLFIIDRMVEYGVVGRLVEWIS